MRKIGTMGLVIAALLIGVSLMEVLAQFYAANIAMQGKLFRPDHSLGWDVLPEMDLVRHNADGEPWRIVTDELGIRGKSTWQDDGRRMLVLGDSYAFGHGVDIEHRFDMVIMDRIPSLDVVSIGVTAYGTDQQVIRARQWTDELRQGDVLLLLTYANDFLDIVHQRRWGRAKPWFELDDQGLVEHPPRISWLEVVRDRSYLASLAVIAWNRDSDEDIGQRAGSAGELYQRIVVERLVPLLDRGVHVVLAHHGDDHFDLPFDTGAVFASVCPKLTSCLELDPFIGAQPDDDVFLGDRHWTELGNRIVGEAIADHVSRSDPL